MDLFIDARDEDAFFFTAFLMRLKMEDYQKYCGDEEAAHGAMAVGQDLVLAFRELGYITG